MQKRSCGHQEHRNAESGSEDLVHWVQASVRKRTTRRAGRIRILHGCIRRLGAATDRIDAPRVTNASRAARSKPAHRSPFALRYRQLIVPGPSKPPTHPSIQRSNQPASHASAPRFRASAAEKYRAAARHSERKKTMGCAIFTLGRHSRSTRVSSQVHTAGVRPRGVVRQHCILRMIAL